MGGGCHKILTVVLKANLQLSIFWMDAKKIKNCGLMVMEKNESNWQRCCCSAITSSKSNYIKSFCQYCRIDFKSIGFVLTKHYCEFEVSQTRFEKFKKLNFSDVCTCSGCLRCEEKKEVLASDWKYLCDKPDLMFVSVTAVVFVLGPFGPILEAQ